jgi:hypothetical protein
MDLVNGPGHRPNRFHGPLASSAEYVPRGKGRDLAKPRQVRQDKTRQGRGRQGRGRQYKLGQVKADTRYYLAKLIVYDAKRTAWS